MVRCNFFARRLGSSRKTRQTQRPKREAERHTRQPEREAERRPAIVPLPKGRKRRSLLISPCVTPTNTRPASTPLVAEPSLSILDAAPPTLPGPNVTLPQHACDLAADEGDPDLATRYAFSCLVNDGPLSPFRALPPLLSQPVPFGSPQSRVALRLFASPQHGASKMVGNSGMWGPPINGRRLTGSPAPVALQGAPTPSCSSGARACDVVQRRDPDLLSRHRLEDDPERAQSNNCNAVEEVLLSIRGSKLQQRRVARLQARRKDVIVLHSENEDGNNSPSLPSLKGKRKKPLRSETKKRQRIEKKTAMEENVPQHGARRLLPVSPLPPPKSHRAIESLIPSRVSSSSCRMRLSIEHSPVALQRSPKSKNNSPNAVRQGLRVSPRRAARTRRPWRVKGGLLLTQTRLERDAAVLWGDTNYINKGELRKSDKVPHISSAYKQTNDGRAGPSRRESDAVESANNAVDSVPEHKRDSRRGVFSRVDSVAESGREGQAENTRKHVRRARALRKDDRSTAVGDDGHSCHNVDETTSGKARAAESARDETIRPVRNDVNGAMNARRDEIQRWHADQHYSLPTKAVKFHAMPKGTSHSKVAVRLREGARPPAPQRRNPEERTSDVEKISVNKQQPNTIVLRDPGDDARAVQAGGATTSGMPDARSGNRRRASEKKRPCVQGNLNGKEEHTVVLAAHGHVSKKRCCDAGSRRTSRAVTDVDFDDVTIEKARAKKTRAASTMAVVQVNDADPHAPTNGRQRTPDAKRRCLNAAVRDDVVVIVDTPVSAEKARPGPISCATRGDKSCHPISSVRGVSVVRRLPLSISDAFKSDDGQAEVPRSNPTSGGNSPVPIHVAPDVGILPSVQINNQVVQETPSESKLQLHAQNDPFAMAQASGVERDPRANGLASPKSSTRGATPSASVAWSATVQPLQSTRSLKPTEAASGSGHQLKRTETRASNIEEDDACNMNTVNPASGIPVLSDELPNVSDVMPHDARLTKGVLHVHPSTALVAFDPLIAAPSAQPLAKAKTKTVKLKGRRRSSHVPLFGPREIANDPISCFTQESPIFHTVRFANPLGRENQYQVQRSCAENPVPAVQSTRGTNAPFCKSVTSHTCVPATPPGSERTLSGRARRSSSIPAVIKCDLYTAPANANLMDVARSKEPSVPSINAGRSPTGMSAQRSPTSPNRPPGAPVSLLQGARPDSDTENGDAYVPASRNSNNAVVGVYHAASLKDQSSKQHKHVRSTPTRHAERDSHENENRLSASADSGHPSPKGAAPPLVFAKVATNGEQHEFAPTSLPSRVSAAPSHATTSCIPLQSSNAMPRSLSAANAVEENPCAPKRTPPRDISIPTSSMFAAQARGEPTWPSQTKRAALLCIPDTIESFAGTQSPAFSAPKSARPLPLTDNAEKPCSKMLVPWQHENPSAQMPLCSPIESFHGSPIGTPIDHRSMQIVPANCGSPRFHPSQLMHYRPQVVASTPPVGVKPVEGGLQELLLQAQKEYLSDCVIAKSRSPSMDDTRCTMWEVAEIIKLPLSLILMLRNGDKPTRCVVPRKHLNHGYCVANVRQGDYVAVMAAQEVLSSTSILLPLVIRKV